MLHDLSTILGWYFAIFLVGIIFLPLTRRIFGHFFDGGYAFSKILGILLTSYTVWLLSSLHIAPFTLPAIIAVLAGWMMVNVTLQISKSKFLISNQISNSKSQTKTIGSLGIGNSLGIRLIRAIRNYRICLFEELLFLSAFLFWVWVRGHEPSIHGLEKFMDFGFINSILNSQFFPPPDMWLASADPELAEGLASNVKQYSGGFFINYYYYGHYVTAFLTKLTGILPEITYNLMLAQIFAFCFGGSFTIGANLMYLFMKSKIPRPRRGEAEGGLNTKSQINSKQQKSNSKQNVLNFELENSNLFGTLDFRFWIYRVIIAGLLTASLVTLAGNLNTIYLFTSGYPNENPVPFWQILKLGWNVSYWYPNATRFIPNTIHEFPSYSWIVADLHGHVLDIPFVLLTIALLLSLMTKSKIQSTKSQINQKSQASNHKQAVLNLRFRILNLSRLCGIPLWRRFGAWNFEFGILLLLGLLTAVMYMTNAWDGIIYLGLTGLVILATHFCLQDKSDKQVKMLNAKWQMINKLQNAKMSNEKKLFDHSAIQPFRYLFSIHHLSFIIHLFILGSLFFLFSLPFNRSFQPFVHGIGIVGGWEFANFLGLIKPVSNVLPNMEIVANNLPKVVKFGPFLLEQGNNLRSPLWMLAVLWGFFYVNVIIFLISIIRKIKFKIQSTKSQINSKQQASNHKQSVLNLKFEVFNLFGAWNLEFRIYAFIFLLILLSTLLLLFPEFFYMKDIYPGHYRANTMFKLGYQAFIMLSIVSGYVIISFINSKFKAPNFKQILNSKHQISKITFGASNLGFRIFWLFLLILVLIYPYFGIQSYYGVFSQDPRKYEGQDGLRWLKNSHPGDYEAVLWLRNNVNPSPYPLPTILEAVGDSYTDYGRISANTGLATVLGWPVHEWLWRGSYDEPGKRVEEARQIYEEDNRETALSLLKKYNVKYIVVGNLEREKYKNLKDDLFIEKGKIVFSSNGTKIYGME